jgi:hypothetical protein
MAQQVIESELEYGFNWTVIDYMKADTLSATL